MPWMENRIGVVRAGTWSILCVPPSALPANLTPLRRSEVVCLIPVLLSFFFGAPPEGERGLAWNAAMLFTGTLSSSLDLVVPLTRL